MTWVMSVLILMEVLPTKELLYFELIQIVTSVDEKERFETVGGTEETLSKMYL